MMKHIYLAAVMVSFYPMTTSAETPLETQNDVTAVVEACLDLAAALDLKAGKAATIQWDRFSENLGQLNSVADDPISVASSATDAGTLSSGGCVVSLKDLDLAQAVFSQIMADRTEMKSNNDSGLCHNDEFISLEFKEWDGTSRYAPGVLATISLTNLPAAFGPNPCAG